MRQILVAALLVLALAVMTAYAAAPTIRTYTAEVGAVTVDSQWTGTVWNLLDSMIIVTDDTATVTFTISGIAIMDPGDKLYVGFGSHTAGATIPNLDTILINPRIQRLGTQRIPFSVDWAECDTLAGTSRNSLFWQGAATDTVYFYGAAGGGGITEAVRLEDVVVQAHIHDNNDCYGGTYDL